jgi:transcriptional regulator with XRE-family HTH domain
MRPLTRERPPLGARIRQARLQARLTQAALAAATSLTREGLANIERGFVTDPALSYMTQIARATGVSLDYLAGLTEDTAVH